MNRITRLINSNYARTSALGRKAFSVCTAIAIAAAVGFTTIAITSPAAAEERNAESQRREADSTVTEDQVRKRLDAAVADGAITQDQADRRFRGWQEQQQTTSGFPSKESMDEGVNAEVEQGNLTEMQAAAIMRVYARLAMGLENDKLSESEAIAILGERSKAIYEGDQGQPGITRQDYAQAQATMQKMVDAGEITKDQMDARLGEMRKMIGRSQPQVTRKDYADAQAAMQKMVDAGEITKEQMDARLVEMRKMIGRSQPKITRKDYDDAVAKMTKMVKDGEMTREQMQQRLDRMKAAMAKQSKSKITRKDYDDAVAKMTKMVKDGEITREQMQQRLDRMKGGVAQDDSSKRKEMSDDCMALGRRIRTAMGKGEMTREEAKEIWEAQGCP